MRLLMMFNLSCGYSKQRFDWYLAGKENGL